MIQNAENENSHDTIDPSKANTIWMFGSVSSSLYFDAEFLCLGCKIYRSNLWKFWAKSNISQKCVALLICVAYFDVQVKYKGPRKNRNGLNIKEQKIEKNVFVSKREKYDLFLYLLIHLYLYLLRVFLFTGPVIDKQSY